MIGCARSGVSPDQRPSSSAASGKWRAHELPFLEGSGTYTYSPTQPHAVTAANDSTYSYDACGNMVTRNRSGQPGQTLTYDAQNRLTQMAIAGGSTIRFGYSAGGTRLWKKVNGEITGLWIGSLYEEKEGKILCHVYAGDRLVATFEPEGSLACIIENNRCLAAAWHTSGRVLAALFGGGHTPTTVMWAAALTGIVLGLRYNRRRLRDRYGLRTYYGLPAFGGTDPWRQMVLLTLAAAVFLSSNPEAALADGPQYDPVFYYYHLDHLGSSQLMTDRQGNVVQQYGYSPFGKDNGPAPTGAFPVSDRYTGQTLDEETGLYYYGARYYDPELARFIQADSMVPDPGSSQGLNRYAYVYNNPLRLTDPTGNYPYDSYLAAAGGAFVGAYMGALQAGMSSGDMLMGAYVGLINGAAGYSLIQLTNSNSTALTSLFTGNATATSLSWDSQSSLTSNSQSWTSPYESPRYSDYSSSWVKPF